jgi:signal transduction histidine kinase
MYYKANPVRCCLQKVLIFFPLMLLLAMPSLAQDNSLQRLMAAKDDTAKVNRLHAYAQNLLNKDNEAAKEIYKTTFTLSEKLGYSLGMATAWRKNGYIIGQEGKYKEGIQSFHNALFFYEKGGGHLKDQLACYNNIGAGYCELGKFDSAMHYQMLAIKKMEAWPLEKEEKAVQKEMLAIISQVNANISNIYSNQQNAAKALEYANRALAIAREIKDTVRISLSIAGISHAHYVNKDFEKALAVAREVEALANQVNHPAPALKAYHLLSVNYLALNKLDSAVYAAKKSTELSKGIDKRLYLSTLLDLADVYHTRKFFREEAVLLQSAVSELKSIDNVTLGRRVYEKFAAAKYALGQFKEAYDLSRIANAYKDSVYSDQNRETVAELDIQYQTAQKEKALVSQQLQITKKNLHLQQSRQHVIYSVTAFFIALSVAGFLIVRQNFKRKQYQRQLQSIKQEQELHLLQAVINGEEKERSRIAKDLHDGVAGMLAAVKMHFSTIADVKVLQQIDGFQQGMGLLNEASQEIRKTAHNLMPEILLAHGLDSALQRYCVNISNSRLQIQYDAWGDITRYKESFELAVYRIVQELLHNVVKHSGASQAIVQLSVQGPILSLTIEDNGIGFKDPAQAEGTGIKSLKQRVSAMNGRIDIDSGGGAGVSAYLEFDTRGLEMGRPKAAAAMG